MSMPHWVRFGARCKCIDDDQWTDLDTGKPSTVRCPVKDQNYTIIHSEDLGFAGFIVLAEMGRAPDLWRVDAFRPLTDEERDAETFDRILKGASAAPVRELELLR